MKKTLYRLSLVTGLIAAGSLSAIAAPGDDAEKGKRQGGPRGPGGPDREAILKEFDKDGNGKLEGAERDAARAAGQAKAEERKAAFIAKYDKDKSGDLNDKEKEAAAADRKAEMEKRILERFDEDDNGKLDDKEQAKADAAMEQMKKRRGGQRPGGRGGRGDKEGAGDKG